MAEWLKVHGVVCILAFWGLQPAKIFAQGIPPALSARDAIAIAELAGNNTVYLETSLNGNEIAELKPFQVRNGRLFAAPEVMRSLGFSIADETVVALDDIDGLHYEYRQDIQRLSLSAPIDSLKLERVQFTNENSKDIQVSTGTGLLLNYDLYAWYSSERYRSASAFSELRFFSPLGVLSSTALFKTATGVQQNPWDQKSVRLDTQWETSWPNSAISLRLGDTQTAALSWSRATRIGGIQLSRNFALQPYFSTAPLPSFLGSADIPSTAELFVNGIRQFEGQVPAGPFDIQTMPYINGAGNATLVLTDTMGKQRTVQLPFYNSTLLLKKGLADWSIEAGYVRRSYGLKSFDYGRDPVYSGSVRYGVSNNLTAEAHGELTQGLTHYGAGVTVRLGQLGIVSGSYSTSRHEGMTGRQVSASYQWQGGRFHVSANLKKAQATYRDVASLYGSEVPQTNQVVSTGLSMGKWGQIGTSLINLKYVGQPASRYVNVYWSKQLTESTSLALNYNKELGNRGNQTLYLGVSINLDNRYSAYMSATALGDRNQYGASVYRRSKGEEGLSWSLQSQYDGRSPALYATASYRGRYGEYSAGIQSNKDSTSAFVNNTGALVLMSGGVFASRQINDGFAVVSTNGVKDVPVQLENREYGMTDSSGLMIVTPLSAYQRNRISIDPSALPANVVIDKVETTVATESRAGTRVLFKVAPVRAATVVLQDMHGQSLPLGTRVTVNHENEALVGYDGIVYLEKLQPINHLEVVLPNVLCRMTFNYSDEQDTIPRIGPLTCKE